MPMIKTQNLLIVQNLQIFSVLLLSMCAQPAFAQTCSHDSSAVADTLDPSGYIRLQIGNVWDYLQESGAFWDAIIREEVVADTLIRDTTLYVIRNVGYAAYTNGPITDADTSYRISGVVDDQIVTFHRGEIRERGIPLSAPFSSCYELNGASMSISGGFDAVWSVREDGERVEYQLPATKSFDWLYGSQTYGHGIGMLQSIGDPYVVRDLLYARIDGKEYGTPIESRFRMSIAREHVPETPDAARLEIFPNPASKRIRMIVRLTDHARVTVEIADVLGRVVAVPVAGRQLGRGEHAFTWHRKSVAAGTYVIRLRIDGQTAATRSVVTVE